MGIAFIDPPEDAKKYPRYNVDHYLRRAFSELRNSLSETHWSVCNAHPSAEHRRKIAHRKEKRGSKPNLGIAVNELIKAIALERAEANIAEAFLRKMLWADLIKADAERRGQ